MKQAKLLMTIAMGGVLISGCHKSDTDYTATPTATATTKPVATNSSATADNVNATITYNLAAVFPAANAGIQWTSGYLTTSQLVFNGTHIVGNMLSQTKFPADIVQTVQLAKMTTLGSVSVLYGSFDYASFSLMLNQSSSAHGLFLAGVYLGGKQQLPVQLMIDAPVQLMSNYINRPTLNAPNYTTTLTLNVATLVTGIDGATLSNATVTNGIIYISATSNGTLYQQVLNNINNLQNIITAQFQSAQQVVSPVIAVNPVSK